ncbi:discoidin domain-containing protein [Sphingobacterium sp. E70]|uniref:discoidin domain-containing protein n=1 Tax=Sphingobacterium sp. E70 TaxID=2853439 RepID=UPI00211C1F9A|nr:discoidin domain-containing protein [Sphingobacterium sp. E70]ULT28367.1 discoidin domain-containing protein [Sphingobacterium sp. E70]
MLNVSSEASTNNASMAFDANKENYWLSLIEDKKQIAIDLGMEKHLNAFVYTPPKEKK